MLCYNIYAFIYMVKTLLMEKMKESKKLRESEKVSVKLIFTLCPLIKRLIIPEIYRVPNTA